MTWPKHWLLRFEGTFRDNNGVALETWSCGIRNVAPEGPVDEDAILAANAERWARLFVEVSWINNRTQIDLVKLNEIGPDGRYTHDVTHEFDVVNDVAGTTPIRGLSSAYVESQRSLAVSWTTPRSRGRAHAGRVYLPGFSAAVGSGLYLSDTGTIAEHYADLLADIKDATPLEPSVVSGVGGGNIQPITGVRVGDRVDTQRRRRRSLVEAYGSFSISEAAERRQSRLNGLELDQ